MIGPTSAASGANAMYGTQQAARKQSASDADASKLLSNLTPADRELINKAFGTTLTAEGVDLAGRGVAPIAAWVIAADRASGALPAGQPITATYLNNMRGQYAGNPDAPAGMVQQIDSLLAALGKSGEQERFDFRA